MLRLKGVSKTYQDDGQSVSAVQDVSAEIGKGEIVALMGPSGCGKSTLLHLLGGMDRPTSGEVWLAGEALHEMGEEELIEVRRHQIGFVFQFFYLLPTMTVLENVELPVLLASGGSARQKALEAIEAVDLSHRLHALPQTLSGGEMQRAALARAVIQRPRAILADEPTGNLDSENGRRVLELLVRLARSQGSTVVMATHSPEAAGFADRTLLMKDGRLAS